MEKISGHASAGITQPTLVLFLYGVIRHHCTHAQTHATSACFQETAADSFKIKFRRAASTTLLRKGRNTNEWIRLLNLGHWDQIFQPERTQNEVFRWHGRCVHGALRARFPAGGVPGVLTAQKTCYASKSVEFRLNPSRMECGKCSPLPN